jgi:hypothetical protein
MGMLGLLIYNNTYTPYKVPGFNGYWYFFIVSFCTMQLVEYFLWRNLHDKKMNFRLSLLGSGLIALQPIASLFLLTNTALRNGMLLLYLVFLGVVGSIRKRVFRTSTTEGHLKWSWVPLAPYQFFIWLFFLMFSFVVNKHYIPFAVALFLCFITYNTKGTGGSLWCWTINLSMIIYAIYLLIYLPLKEKMC